MPIAHDLAQAHLRNGDPIEAAAKIGMGHLHQCYQALSSGSIFAEDILLLNSSKFALQYVALEDFTDDDPKAWRAKP